MTARPSMAVIILTKNEESNLPFALESVAGWADRVIVVDSGSTDRTIEIARQTGCEVIIQEFRGYASQRNRGLAAASDCEWALFLDADETVPADLRTEVDRTLCEAGGIDGFFVRYRLIWGGQWIRRGYYGSWLLRLVRVGRARCEERSVNEHVIVDGATGRLSADLLHDNRKGIGDWVAKHIAYARKEAEAIFTDAASPDLIEPSLVGSHRERVRWMRTKIWNRMPPVIRPAFYFMYRYVLRGGFLDGRQAFAFHVLQAFWYPILIDLMYLEMLQKRNRARRLQ